MAPKEKEEKIDLSKLTSEQLLALKAKIKAVKPIVKYRSLVNETCVLPPERAKEILCKMAKDVEQKSIEGGWQKVVLSAIKANMK